MKKENDVAQSVCGNFCPYYKPGKKEGLSCKGYDVVERLVRRGKHLPLEEPSIPSDPAATELLVQTLCHACVFREQDCDFMQDRTSPPCGGFALLLQLVTGGVLSAGDIKNP